MIRRPDNSTICVVDTQPDDYSALVQNAPKEKAEVRFLNCGRAALRLKAGSPPELWIINMRLPDMSGLDLYGMIRSRYPGVPVYLVADNYQAEDEINARSCGATMYFCKPLQSDWLLAPKSRNTG